MKDYSKLDEFIEEYQLNRKEGMSIVKSKDLSKLKSQGFTAEELFQHLINKYDVLLHGSIEEINDTHLKSDQNKVFGSDYAPIALMRGVISNRGLKSPGLAYPYIINEENPMAVKIHGIHDKTIFNNGFIYVINKENFENDPKGSWQHINRSDKVPIIAKIEISREDFTHPIYDVTNNKRIQ